MTQRVIVLASVSALALVLAGCSSNDTDREEAQPDSTQQHVADDDQRSGEGAASQEQGEDSPATEIVSADNEAGGANRAATDRDEAVLDMVEQEPSPFPPRAFSNIGGALDEMPGFGGMARPAAPGETFAVDPQAGPQPQPGDIDRERFPDAEFNPVKLVSEEPVSTFSVDVDTASYSVARRYLNDGTMPPQDAVRVEEVINYFDYDYPLPETREAPFAVTATVTDTPWNTDTQLIHIGIKGYDIEPDERPRANLVFLLDVSGSMNSPDKLPLLKQSMRLLVDNLDDDDTVAIAVYAGAAGVVLEPTPASDSGKIIAALENLSAGGSTAGGEGLRLAYALAEQNFDSEAINRVILATDGDFNVGVVDDGDLEGFIERKRDTGVFLSILGFGRGNYNDRLMQTLAQAGNGQAAYLDTLNEARKVLQDEMQGALFPIAKDVKIQVEFNPQRVAEYRLIGYETRMLNREDFNNDQVDAGEIGAGHEVTAIYEIAAPGSDGRLIDDSRYATTPAVDDGSALSDEFANLRIRYKLPDEDDSTLIERVISTSDQSTFDEAPQATRFAVAAAGFAQLLRGEPYLRDFDYDSVIAIAQAAKGEDVFNYRGEFIQLARSAKSAPALPTLERPGFGGERVVTPLPN